MSGEWKDDYDRITIEVPAAFRYAQNLHYLTRSADECLYQVRSDCIYKVLPLKDCTPIIELSAGAHDTLLLRFVGGSSPSLTSERAAVVDYVRDWFDLETDLQPFYAMVKADPLLSPVVSDFSGLRLMGIPDLFEALSWGIIGQQINLKFAYTLKRRLVERFGRSVSAEEERYWLFPDPQDIASLDVSDLTPLQLTTRKAEYLIGVAKLIAEGKLSKESLAQQDLVTATRTLVGIRGIGPWTAHYVLMRCLRHPSAFPIDDVGLHNAIKHVLQLEKKPSKQEIARLASSWTGWEAYATFYLWRVLY